MRLLLAILAIALAGVGVLVANGGLPFASAAPTSGPTTNFDPFGQQRPTSAPVPAKAATPPAAGSPAPLIAASPAASPAPAASEIVAVVSQTDQKLSLVDPATGKVAHSVDLGIPPKDMALTQNGHTAWVFSSKPGETDFITVDLLKGERKDSKRLHDNPSAAAFSTDGRRAYVALSGGNASPPSPDQIVFLDTKNNDEFGHVDIGEQSPGVQIFRRIEALLVAPGPNGDVLYAAGAASGTVWALDGGSGALIKQIDVGGGPIVLLSDTSRQRVYVIADTINQVVAIDTTTLAIANRLTLPGRPSAAAVAPDGTLYIAGGDAGLLWTVSPDLTQVGAAVPIGSHPMAVGVSLDGARVYVASSGDNSLAVVDPRGAQVTSRIPVGKDPIGLLVAPGKAPAGSTPMPTTVPAAHPTATPTIVPAPTPLPQGELPPEHMVAGAVSDAFVPDAAFAVSFAFAPDGTMFYNELQTGKIRIVRNGQLLPDPFYQFKVAGQPETGLIGLALDPNFSQNHYVYVFYTSVPEGQDTGGPNGPNEVVRLTDVADKGTDPTPILKDLPSGPIHNSGQLRFGPDGKLYVSLGDNDQGSNAQDLGSIAGKILRVNSDGSIPNDNPFVGQEGKQPAIWAYGVRNMFSFDFDPVSHGLLATENGPGDNDELDLIVKGGNYGWPPTGYKYKAGIVDPIAVMNPPIGPTGMAFYTADQIPEWKNDWFYCNYHQGQLRRVRLAPESRDRVVFEEIVKNGCSLGVATGPDGALYYSGPKGIYRIHSSTAANLLPAVSPATMAAAAAATPSSASPQPTPAPTEQPLPAGTRAEDRDINVSMSEWKLQPSRPRVPAGQLRFLSEDTGATQHALRIVGQGVDVSTDNFGPGESRTINIVLQAGEYQLICPIPGHQQQGMAASLTVVGQ
jgi:YVTN family beta-propeller protein